MRYQFIEENHKSWYLEERVTQLQEKLNAITLESYKHIIVLCDSLFTKNYYRKHFPENLFPRLIFEERIFTFAENILRPHGSHVGVRPNFQLYRNKEDFIMILDFLRNSEFTSDMAIDLEDVSTEDVAELLGISSLTAEDIKKKYEGLFCEGLTVQQSHWIKEWLDMYHAYLESNNALDCFMVLRKTTQLFQIPFMKKHYHTIYQEVIVESANKSTALDRDFLNAFVDIQKEEDT